MTTAILAISGISIKQDSRGRFCLNDLHKAAGGEAKHKPDNWKRAQQAVDLISLLESENCNFKPVDVINGGVQRGTYVVKELVYAYAMWISAKFHIAVIRAYDSMVNPKPYGLKELPPSTISTEMQRHIQEMVKAQHRRTGIHWQTIYDQFKTHFEIPRYDELPITKYAEACLWFGCKTQYDLPQYMLIDVRELENLQSNQLSNCILPPEPQVFPDNYHQFIDIVNKMEDASYRIFKKDILVSLHEMLSKMI